MKYINDGKEITINAPENNADNRYIRKLTLNGKEYPKNYLSHKVLTGGATLDFEMTNKPDKERGTSIEDFPFSLSNAE